MADQGWPWLTTAAKAVRPSKSDAAMPDETRRTMRYSTLLLDDEVTNDVMRCVAMRYPLPLERGRRLVLPRAGSQLLGPSTTMVVLFLGGSTSFSTRGPVYLGTVDDDDTESGYMRESAVMQTRHSSSRRRDCEQRENPRVEDG